MSLPSSLLSNNPRMSSNATQLWELLERSGCPAAPLSGEWTDLRAVAKARALSKVFFTGRKKISAAADKYEISEISEISDQI